MSHSVVQAVFQTVVQAVVQAVTQNKAYLSNVQDRKKYIILSLVRGLSVQGLSIRANAVSPIITSKTKIL